MLDTPSLSLPRSVRNTLAVFLIAFLGVLIVDRVFQVGTSYLNYTSWQRPMSLNDTIMVTSDAKVVAIPDVALVSLSVESRGKSPGDVLSDNKKKMNDMTGYLAGLSIAQKDIRTSQFNLTPNYVYNNTTGKSDIDGYILTQTLDVKIRDLKRVSDILSESVTRGANQVGQLSFIIDDPAELMQQARLDALKKAEEKAHSLAAATGLRVVKVRTFHEDTFDDGYPMVQMSRNMTGGAEMGGGGPDIQMGSNEIRASVTVTYEVE